MLTYIFTLVLISFLHNILAQQMQEQPSENLYVLETKVLLVPKDVQSYIYGNETWIQNDIISMILIGELIIKPIQDLRIKYENLIFFESGKLTIIQEPFTLFKLVLEQISNQTQCILYKQSGMINIISQQNYGYSQIEKIENQNEIFLQDNSQVDVNQQIFFYQFDDNSYDYQNLYINEKSEKQISINEQININELSFQSSIIPNPIAIFSVKTKSDIIFKKQIKKFYQQQQNKQKNHQLYLKLLIYYKIHKQFSFTIFFNLKNFLKQNSCCLSARFENISGVVFLNLVKLKLVGGKLKNCLFLNDQTSIINRQIERQILIKADLEDNNFLNLTDIYFEFNGNKIINNIFYGIKNGLMKITQVMKYTFIIDSDVNINFDNQQLKLSNFKIHNSKVVFHNELRGINMRYIYFFNSLVRFDFDVSDLQMMNCKLIESTIEFQQKISKLEILESYIYNKKQSNYIIMISQNSILNNNIYLNIVNSTIKDSFNSFLHRKGCNGIEERCEGYNNLSQDNVSIMLKNNKINIQNQYSQVRFLFNIKARIFQYRFYHYSQLFPIRSYNREYPIFNNIKIPGYEKDFSLVNKSPSFYKIIDLVIFNSFDQNYILLINNQKQNIQQIDSEDFQILDQTEQRLTFENLEYNSVVPKIIELQIQNYHSSFLEPGKYQIILPLVKYATLKIQISLKFQREVIEIELNYENQIFNFFNLNLTISFVQENLWINWSSFVEDSFTIKLKFDYCQPGQIILFGDKCRVICPSLQSGKYCSNNCIQGYYQLNENQCESCPEGCLQCDLVQQMCKQCLPEMILFNGQCHFKCPRGYYLSKNKECSKCDDYCGDCQNTNSCFECQDFYVNSNMHGCSQCLNEQVVEDDVCIDCHQNCEYRQCNGSKQIDCLQCKSDYIYYFGECISQTQN